ncbi:hypothetical protein GIB67_022788 [Kingdonia uniflora]|uniref:Kinesin motor domain-containing protein n=1 Tax=Kingdonia uniflora TaxID=39325 RepID=A0A7J7P6N1_9MAGN|nr:hypothetical protein GIB67_022788 [Kingdonia uniflora]
MASSITASKANSSSDLRRKVRIVAKIRANNDLEMLGSEGSWHKPIGDQPTSRKDSYKFDYCYEQGENVDQIFSREVKPLISQVFDGVNASVLAYGARGSGKTYMIQGSDEKPGLALLAMAEILSICEKSGNIVKVSCYQVFQDHAYDLLQSSGHEVLVLEDSQGKIQLKGLSEASIAILLN